jgi:uncharacterized protein YjbI with pentapeptide repeats
MRDGRRCGLPIYKEINPIEISRDSERRCVFHIDPRDRQDPIRDRLVEALDLNAILERAQLGGENLDDLEIVDAELSDACFNNAHLRRSSISNASLEGADFTAAHLDNATLSHCNLAEAVLVEANLNEATLDQATDLHEARAQRAILEAASIKGCRLVGTDLTGAILSDCRIEDGCSLENAKLAETKLDGIVLTPDTDLHEAEWDEGDMIGHERMSRTQSDAQETVRGFSTSVSIYRQIKLAYQTSGDYRRAGNFFLRETECQRALMAAKRPLLWTNRIPTVGEIAVIYTPNLHRLLHTCWNNLSHYATRAVWWLSNLICHHGENPGRLLGVMGLLIVMFAVVHAHYGIQGHEGRPNIGPGLYFGMPDMESITRFWHAIYFSVVTFTSLGYGDYSPRNEMGQICACAEAFIGVILIAVFVGCMIRKISR